MPAVYPECLNLVDDKCVSCMDMLCDILCMLQYIHVFDASVVLHAARDVLAEAFEERAHAHGQAAVLVAELYYMPTSNDVMNTIRKKVSSRADGIKA